MNYLCIHGHFYQPPRENAWLEIVELQESALPFHDWNERINFECYAPNAAARILDEERHIIKIVNNYSQISFNFGPTLLSWMEQADPSTYRKIQAADKLSLERFDGHGSAVAQAHSHLILPLCNERDKQTQVIWGIRDFEYRFGRKPEGMWLAETAANTECLEVMAEHGIKYTILAPRQAKAWRKIGDTDWNGSDHHSVDTRRPYRCHLPSGKHIDLFFYDGEVAQEVAFKRLLDNGKGFANRLISRFSSGDEPHLVHIATDGESYGHHHRYGEMALADALNYIEENNLAKITNYGQYLELFPPTYEAQIHENSSWSCVHGVERWQANCGCNTGGNHGWNQEWRRPLRDALDWLREEIIKVYEKQAKKLLKDVWAARNDYIDVIVNRTEERLQAFLKKHGKKKIKGADQIQVLRLMEMQRHAMFMYTSCGWFFDEVSGIETNQILQYALRTTDYAVQVAGVELHEGFLKRLAKSPSNVYANAAESYEKLVIPSKVGLTRAGMHFAVSSLFEKDPRQLDLFKYTCETEKFEKLEAGTQKLAMGRMVMKSKVTQSLKHFSFAAVYMGQQNIVGSINVNIKEEHFDEMQVALSRAFRNNQIVEMIRIMQYYFGHEHYSFHHLFRDEKRKILQQITERNFETAESDFREIYNDNYQLMTSMLQSDIPVPTAYYNVVRFIVNADLERFFEHEELSLSELRRLVSELKKWNIQLDDQQSFKLAGSERIFYELRTIAHNEVPLEHLVNLNNILSILHEMNYEFDIWKSQNVYFSMMQGYKKGEWVFVSDEWKAAFLELGKWLKVKVDELVNVPV